MTVARGSGINDITDRESRLRLDTRGFWIITEAPEVEIDYCVLCRRIGNNPIDIPC